MKRVAIIGGVSNYEVIKGGVHSVVFNLSTQFQNFPEYEFYLYGNKIVEKSINNTYFRNLLLPIPQFGLFVNFLLFGSKIIKQIDESIKPDIYHFQDTVPNIILLKNNIRNKTVITQHGILMEEMKSQPNIFKKIKFFIKELVERHYIPGSKNLIFISNYNLRYVCDKYPILKSANNKLIRNPIHSSFFNQKKSNLKELRLYFVGRITKLKGFHDLLIALNSLIKLNIRIKLEVIGDFTDLKYKKFIHSIIKNNNLNDYVSFHGWQNKDGIIEISSQCNVYILPSYQETLPVSLAEAMALGKAVIATRLPGVEEMIEDGESGFLYLKGNVKELSKKIQYLYDNSELIKQAGEKASIIAERMFNPKNILQETIDFYQNILNSNYQK